MCGPNMSLQIAGVGEHLVAVFTGESPKLSMYHLVAQEVGPPGEGLVAVVADILVGLVAVAVHHVTVQAGEVEGHTGPE